MVVVGTSWGGLAALKRLVQGLPEDFAAPLVVVQHRHKDSDSVLARALQTYTALSVCEVEDKMPLSANALFLAPPDYHLLVEADGFSLSTDAPVHYSRPSIDVTFISAADTFGAGVTGVVLTGANDDGARGLQRIVKRGGRAIVQDPMDAEASAMPRAAVRAVPSARVLPLDRIPEALVAYLAAGRGDGVSPDPYGASEPAP